MFTCLFLTFHNTPDIRLLNSHGFVILKKYLLTYLQMHRKVLYSFTMKSERFSVVSRISRNVLKEHDMLFNEPMC